MNNHSSWIEADRIGDLLGKVMAVPPDEREAYLDEICSDDEVLRREVESLVQPLIEARGWLVSPDRDGVADSHVAGTMVGDYKLLQKIGEGGFGNVFLARQTEPIRRDVALKIIKLGMDTEQVIARFEAERQALAMMHHPNIANVFDAGATSQGRPYFVMELVRGEPITMHADRKRLSTNERLGMFRDVCLAVQHAHSKGIIHRDLKPSNVLVTVADERSIPKVIDFGVAKATNSELTERTLLTEFRQLIGTPEYMSPEQAERSGFDIDTRSDVYSLGVILYELLTGMTPHDPKRLRSADWMQMQRIICDEEPARPSARVRLRPEVSHALGTLRREDPSRIASRLRGDLDCIIMKALAKERSRRYQTAAELAEDIERHLEHRPVKATSPSAFYQFSRFVRRNRARAAGVGIATIAAIFAVATLVVSLARIDQERNDALEAKAQTETALAESRAVTNFLGQVLDKANPNRLGPKATIHAAVDAASHNIESELDEQPLAAAHIQHVLGMTYVHLSEFDDAEPHLVAALETREALLGEADRLTIDTLAVLGMLYRADSRYDEAETALLRACELADQALDPLDEVAMQARSNLASLRFYQSRYEDALDAFTILYQQHRQVLGELHPTTLQIRKNLAATYSSMGDRETAERMERESIDICRTLYGEEHPQTLGAVCALGTSLAVAQRYDEAESILVEAYALSRKNLGESHVTTLVAASGLIKAYLQNKRLDEGEAILERTLPLLQEHRGEDHVSTLEATNNLAFLYMQKESYEDAIELLTQALPVFERVAGPRHDRTVITRFNIADSLLNLERYAEAEPHLLFGYEVFADRFGATHNYTATFARRLADLYKQWGRDDDVALWAGSRNENRLLNQRVEP